MMKPKIVIQSDGATPDAECTVQLESEIPESLRGWGFEATIGQDTAHWLARQSDNDRRYIGKLMQAGMLAARANICS